MDGIEKHAGAHLVRPASNGAHVIHGTRGVRSTAHGNQPRTGVEFAAQIVQVERAILRMNVHVLQVSPGVTRHELPRRHVGVVVQQSYQHFVTGIQQPAESAAQMEGQGGHVGAENDLVR